MKTWSRWKPIPYERRQWGDAIRGGIAFGIITSLPAGALTVLVVLVTRSSPLTIPAAIAASVVTVSGGAFLGARFGWVYGIKARGDFYMSRYARIRCRYCDYDLTGSVSDFCPECGGPLRPAQIRYRNDRARS